MPRMKSVLMLVPILGAGWIWSGSRSITSSTESASAPMMVVSPSSRTSTTIMQVFTVFCVPDIPNARRKSTTGTTLPRRLMTPRMNSGVRGIFVMAVKSKTSRTVATSNAKVSLSSLKVRYWRISVIVSTLIVQPFFRYSPSILLELFIQFVVPSVESQRETVAFAGGLRRRRRRAQAGLGAMGWLLRQLRVRLGRGSRGGLVQALDGARQRLIADIEEVNGAHHLLRLAGEFFTGRSHLFRRGSVLLNDGLKRLERGIDLLGAGVLFVAGGADFLYELRRLLNIGNQLLEHLARLLGYLHGRRRQLVDLSRRLLAALGQLAHFRGDHREPFTMLARARRFYGRVQGQHVGLPRDLLDYGDLVRNFLHRVYRLRHRPAAFLGIISRLGGDLLGLLRIFRVLLDIGDHLLHRGRRLFSRGCLAVGALRQLIRRGAHRLAAARNLAGRSLDIDHHFGYPIQHRAEGLHELVFGRAFAYLHLEIAARNLLRRVRDLVHGAD